MPEFQADLLLFVLLHWILAQSQILPSELQTYIRSARTQNAILTAEIHRRQGLGPTPDSRPTPQFFAVSAKSGLIHAVDRIGQQVRAVAK